MTAVAVQAGPARPEYRPSGLAGALGRRGRGALKRGIAKMSGALIFLATEIIVASNSLNQEGSNLKMLCSCYLLYYKSESV
jgi:hypothetical protein